MYPSKRNCAIDIAAQVHEEAETREFTREQVDAAIADLFARDARFCILVADLYLRPRDQSDTVLDIRTCIQDELERAGE